MRPQQEQELSRSCGQCTPAPASALAGFTVQPGRDQSWPGAGGARGHCGPGASEVHGVLGGYLKILWERRGGS